MILDFSPLSDDQLIDLIRAACQEAAKRGNETRFAAESVMLDEATKARIAREAAEKAAIELHKVEAQRIAEAAAAKVKAEAEQAEREAQKKKVDKVWAIKDEIDTRLHALLHSHTDYKVVVWNKTDKRVYIRTATAKFGSNSVEYFADGNSKTRPGTLKLIDDHEPIREQIAEFCKWLCEKWQNLEHDSNAASDASKKTCQHPKCVASCEAEAA